MTVIFIHETNKLFLTSLNFDFQLVPRYVSVPASVANFTSCCTVPGVLSPHVGVHDLQRVVVLGSLTWRHFWLLRVWMEEAKCCGYHRTLSLRAFFCTTNCT